MSMLPVPTLMVATFVHVLRGTLEMDILVNVRFYQHKSITVSIKIYSC